MRPLSKKGHGIEKYRKCQYESALLLQQLCSLLEDVLRQCADGLGMDPDEVRRSGTLLCGTEELRDLSDLEEGQMHEVTLVLS